MNVNIDVCFLTGVEQRWVWAVDVKKFGVLTVVAAAATAENEKMPRKQKVRKQVWSGERIRLQVYVARASVLSRFRLLVWLYLKDTMSSGKFTQHGLDSMMEIRGPL